MNTIPSIDYYILLLNRKKVSLVKLHDGKTEEINDGIFPKSFTDEYEYAKSSRGNSFGYALKNFEKDKSFVKKERFTHFLREVNENLKNYISKNSALVLAGTDEERAEFRRISSYNHLIADEFSGSFNSTNLSQLKQLIANSTKILHHNKSVI